MLDAAHSALLQDGTGGGKTQGKLTSLDGGWAYLSILPLVEGHADGSLQVGLNLSKQRNEFESASEEHARSRIQWHSLSCGVYHAHSRAPSGVPGRT